MKQLLFALATLLSVTMHAQVPQGIPYQAVIRDTQGNPILNQSVTVKFTLHDQAADGAVVYEETHQTSTNSVGLFSLTFGAGVAATGNFSSINWASGYKFLQVQTDIGNGYVDNGTQQLMSVPYALYAGSAGNTQVSNPDVMRLGKGFSMVSQLSPNTMGYAESIEYCANLTEGGYDDWRFPSYEEVMDYLTTNGAGSATFVFNTTTIHPGNAGIYLMRVAKESINQNVYFTMYQPSYNSTSLSAVQCSCVR
jgi:hypothetical protein